VTYRGEVCEDCGFPVSFFTRSYWNAPPDLWKEVVGTQSGEDVILCPPCFTLRAWQRDIHVHWVACSKTLPDTEEVPSP
jgi:hypothetical protein